MASTLLSLPPELLGNIFYFLDPASTQALILAHPTTCAQSILQGEALRIVKQDTSRFFELFRRHVRSHPQTLHTLETLIHFPSPTINSLSRLKREYLLPIKGLTISILCPMHRDERLFLETAPLPPFFENIHTTSEHLQSIGLASFNPSDKTPFLKLLKTLRAAPDPRDEEMTSVALKILDIAPPTPSSEIHLRALAKILIRTHDWEWLGQIGRIFSHERVHAYFLEILSPKLARQSS